MHLVSVLFTFLAVAAGWVIFRADSFHTAAGILQGMAGMNGFLLPDEWLHRWGKLGQWLMAHGYATPPFSYPLIKGGAINWIWISLLVIWLAPNTQQIMALHRPGLGIPEGSPAAKRLLWRPTYAWLIAGVLCATFGILAINELSEFIYFQF
jgi:alginate O-acetyltransferase complex protein AlgI